MLRICLILTVSLAAVAAPAGPDHSRLRGPVDVYRHAPAANEPAYVVIGGRDIIVNGDFEDGSAWKHGPGWAIEDGVAAKVVGVAGALYQLPRVRREAVYFVTFTIADVTAGCIRPIVGAAVGEYVCSSGTHTQAVRASRSEGGAGLLPDADFDGGISSVAVFDLLRLGEPREDCPQVVKLRWRYNDIPDGGRIDIFDARGWLDGWDVFDAGSDAVRWPQGLPGQVGCGAAIVLSPGGDGVRGSIVAHAR